MDEVSIEIIRQCQNGSAEAFSEVVECYERPIFAYIYRILQGKQTGQDVEDAVQEVFVKAYCRIQTYNCDRENIFSIWLFRVARNHCLDALRKKSSANRAVHYCEGEIDGIADDVSLTPRESASRKEISEWVADAVSKLPEQIRSAFVLRHYEERSIQEIASIMDCSAGTIKSRLSRAREKLCRELKDVL